MKTNYRFIPTFRTVDLIENTSSQLIQNEPMLYGASLRHVVDNYKRYPLTYDVLHKILQVGDFQALIVNQAQLGYHPVIDTKVVLLMPGMYPCIGGWHCDGVIRKDQHSQPNLDTLNEPIQHFICTISDTDEHCGTEILSSNIMCSVDTTANVWAQVSNYVESIDSKEIYTTKSGEIVQFNRQTLHRGTAATVRQWRYFFRLSFYHMPAMNQERKQVQVYSDISQGW